MGRKRIHTKTEEIPKRKTDLRTGKIVLNPLKEVMKKQVADRIKKQVADGIPQRKLDLKTEKIVLNPPKDGMKKQVADGMEMQVPDEKKIKALALGGRESVFDLMEQSDGDDDRYQHSHDSEVSSLGLSSGDDLGRSVILPCGNLGDVKIVKERDSVFYLKDHSGKEGRLDPSILFANLSEADRSRLLEVFAQRPDTFMHLGSLGAFFVRFALESFSRMWGLLEDTNIGDLCEADLDDLLRSFGDMQRCLIKTDWVVAKLKGIWRLKKERLERIEKLKTIDTKREQARVEIEDLKVLLYKAEEKKHKLDEDALATKSEEDKALEWSVVEGLFGGRNMWGKHVGVEQNHVKKLNRDEWRTTSKGGGRPKKEQTYDELRGRSTSDGRRVSFERGKHFERDASNREFLVVMAGEKPTAVISWS